MSASRVGLVLLALAGCAPQPSPPVPGWEDLTTLTIERLDDLWGSPISVDTFPNGRPFRSVYSEDRQALSTEDGDVVHLVWERHPIGGRERLGTGTGIPQARWQFRGDSLFAAVFPPDSTVLIEALDNGDRTWVITMVRVPRPAAPGPSPTEQWLRGDSLF